MPETVSFAQGGAQVGPGQFRFRMASGELGHKADLNQTLSLHTAGYSSSLKFAVSAVSGDGSRTLLVHYSAASNGTDVELAGLASEWKRTRQKASSSIVKLVMHPTYQRIIGKGMAAVPFILRELERDPDHWFWALTSITGEDPVPEDDRGDLNAMARAWIEWGKKSGYL